MLKKTHGPQLSIKKAGLFKPSPVTPQHHCGRLLVHWLPTRALPNKIFQTQLPRNVNLIIDNWISWRLKTTWKKLMNCLNCCSFQWFPAFNQNHPSPASPPGGCRLSRFPHHDIAASKLELAILLQTYIRINIYIYASPPPPKPTFLIFCLDTCSGNIRFADIAEKDSRCTNWMWYKSGIKSWLKIKRRMFKKK